MPLYASSMSEQTYRDALSFNQFTLRSAMDELRSLNPTHDHRESTLLTRGCLACLVEKLRRVAELDYILLHTTDMNDTKAVSAAIEKAVSVYKEQ